MTLRVAVPDAGIVEGVMEAFTSGGAKTNRSTFPANPLSGVVVIDDVPGVKVSILTVVGLALREKSGAITVTETKPR